MAGEKEPRTLVDFIGDMRVITDELRALEGDAPVAFQHLDSTDREVRDVAACVVLNELMDLRDVVHSFTMTIFRKTGHRKLAAMPAVTRG